MLKYMINTAHADPPKKKVVQNVGGVQAKVGGVRTPPTPQVVAPLRPRHLDILMGVANSNCIES